MIRTSDPSALVWRAWDGEIVIFNAASGDTHRLDPLAAEIFECLLRGPADETALAGDIAAAFDLPPSADLMRSIEAVVGQLQGWGLAVREPA